MPTRVVPSGSGFATPMLLELMMILSMLLLPLCPLIVVSASSMKAWFACSCPMSEPPIGLLSSRLIVVVPLTLMVRSGMLL